MNCLDLLLKERRKLLETIGKAADDIASIDSQIAIIKSQELEASLIAAEEAAKT